MANWFTHNNYCEELNINLDQMSSFFMGEEHDEKNIIYFTDGSDHRSFFWVFKDRKETEKVYAFLKKTVKAKDIKTI